MGKVQSPEGIIPGGLSGPFTASDLPIDDKGRVYHLQARPEQIAKDILLVGDPGRAEFLAANFLRDIEFKHENRGLVTITGTSRISVEQDASFAPLRVTITTSGMGTPSLEIIASELVALNEIDFETRTRKPDFPRLHFLRLGSSGGLQASTELGIPIITTYAIGLDNTGLYYNAPHPDENCARLEDELSHKMPGFMSKHSRFFGKIHPYVSRAEPNLVRALKEASTSLGVPTKAGLTVSAPGFFIPEGRAISRVKPTIPELDMIFSAFNPNLEGQCVENMEMEASFLLHFSGGLGYWAGAICPTIANRQQDTFTTHYQDAMENAAKVALLGLAMLRNRHPDARIQA